jgi:hypothetical protein
VSGSRAGRRGRAPARLDWLEVPFHHGSHNHLLERVEPATVRPADLDAVIVPTNRPVSCLREATRLAGELGCRLVAMCSRSASASEAASQGKELKVEVLAIDTTGLQPVPGLVTARPPADRRFARDSDLSLKRNLGLLLARVAGWDRVLFLDDDISGARAAEVRAAAGLLRDYPVVGLRNDDKLGYPDNSVVCHAYRTVGGGQDSFVGGGAVAVSPGRIGCFFPDVYNEDWFVFFGAVPIAVTGRVVHKPYDPFATPERAQAEEFGDCLAEGLFWLLDEVPVEDLSRAEQGRARLEQAGTYEFWCSFLARRQSFLREVLGRLWRWDGKPDQRDRMIASVEAAQRWNSYVTPGACVRYVRQWRQDVHTWQRHLANLPDRHPLDQALKELGLADRGYRSG